MLAVNFLTRDLGRNNASGPQHFGPRRSLQMLTQIPRLPRNERLCGNSKPQPTPYASFHCRQLRLRQPSQQSLGFDSRDGHEVLDQKSAALEEVQLQCYLELGTSHRLRVGDDRDQGAIRVGNRLVLVGLLRQRQLKLTIARARPEPRLAFPPPLRKPALTLRYRSIPRHRRTRPRPRRPPGWPQAANQKTIGRVARISRLGAD